MMSNHRFHHIAFWDKRKKQNKAIFTPETIATLIQVGKILLKISATFPIIAKAKRKKDSAWQSLTKNFQLPKILPYSQIKEMHKMGIEIENSQVGKTS